MPALSRTELLQWADSSVAFYGLDMGRIGSVLLAQLYAAQNARIFSIFAVTDEIKALEQTQIRSHTAAESRFNHPPLTGFHKKHFITSHFLAKNLGNFARSKAGRKHFDESWKSAVAKNESGFFDEAFIGRLVHDMTVGGYESKSEADDLTGEWIVFKKRAEKNYYLTLASHCESNDEIYKRVLLCTEFDGVSLGNDEV